MYRSRERRPPRTTSSRRSASPATGRRLPSSPPTELSPSSDLRAQSGQAGQGGRTGAVSPDVAAEPTISSTSSSSPKAAGDSIRACDRCRNFKKKCSRTFPTCSLCASSGNKCSFSTPVVSSAAQTHHLRARIDWLTSFINNKLPDSEVSGIEAINTGTDLSSLLASASPRRANHLLANARYQPPASTSATSRGISSDVVGSNNGVDVNGNRQSEAAIHAFSAPSQEQQQQERRQRLLVDSMSLEQLSNLATTIESASQLPKSLHQLQLPLQMSVNEPVRLAPGIDELPHGSFPGPGLAAMARNAIARRFVDAYFRHINRAYPFVNRSKVLRKFDTVTSLSRRRGDTESTLLHLIMALGCTTLQRVGQVPGDTASNFDVQYAEIIQECLVGQDEGDSMQILVLLALYALWDPQGISTWSIIGIVARQAMLSGLSRKDSEDKKHLPAIDVELRCRLFWSIYVLDRVVAISLGVPVALADNNIDIPLPGLTVEEFASPDRQYYASMLQTNRHVIQLRQLEDSILSQIHTRKRAEVAALSQADREVTLKQFRSDIENWYSNGCLVSHLEADNVPIHSSVTWLSARYYHLLLLLHYPCHFNSGSTLVSPVELLRWTQRHLQSTSALLLQRQLPINQLTLCRILPVGLILLHCFSSCPTECVAHSATDDVSIIISILEAFPDRWLYAHQAVQVFRQLMNVNLSSSNIGGNGYGRLGISDDYNPSSQSVAAAATASLKDSYADAIRSLIDDHIALMRRVLGKSTCYALYKFPKKRRGQVQVAAMSLSSGQTLGSSPSGPTVHATAAATPITNEDYVWLGTGLDFL
ncbi:fungal specific transcription factor domain-containing protein [Paramyrothecium foliicola]|nr:fungal specific transcription factor domain-containing protein [Paramyrothecium foliicola]